MHELEFVLVVPRLIATRRRLQLLHVLTWAAFVGHLGGVPAVRCRHDQLRLSESFTSQAKQAEPHCSTVAKTHASGFNSITLG